MRILFLGASYGSLLGIKCAAAGHSADMVCKPAEADAINRDGAIVRFPVKDDDGRDLAVDVNSRELPGKLTAGGTDTFVPSDYDLVVLAMQEPQYRVPEVRKLLEAVAVARVPCLSIMNMPPLPYLQRVPAIDVDRVRDCYTDPDIWREFDPALITLCSPDPQALRLPETPLNLLHVRLATNFKAAGFQDPQHTALLRQLEHDIDSIRFESGGTSFALPVKLRVHESPFVPLAKWCMLLTGNYRCVQPRTTRSIAEAVHDDLEASRATYLWVAELCRTLGAADRDLVPFEKYAEAARLLTSPSSAARALANGACHIERVDALVQRVAGQHGMRSRVIDEIVSRVDAWLCRNGRAAVAAQD
jgi:hypothetical protein